MGTLFIVATPIGNLGDITSRALQTLREVDLIACEDTRQTIKLLNHFGIQTPMTSYHEFNEEQKAEELAAMLVRSTNIALVSDAGTPAISDPGYRLVRSCRERQIPVVTIPGPNAAVSALAASGLPSSEFLFLGFLPSKRTLRRQKLNAAANAACTLVFYEAPHRIEAALEDIEEVLGNREACIARELTKVHEEFLLGKLSEIRPRVKPIGEFVVMVRGAAEQVETPPATRAEVLKRLGMTRNQLYDLFFKKGNS
jgi:16S rRNA (cytidine1402-2'-O)-methyltransferase